MPRAQQQIIAEILDWRNPYTHADIEQHVCTEMMALGHQIDKSPQFEKRYAQRGGELPATMVAKLDDCIELLHHWKDVAEKERVLSDKDKSVVSDLLEFIMVPFYRFGASSAVTLGNYGNIAEVMGHKPSGSVVRLGGKAEQLSGEHRYLSNLLIELCDSSRYSIPPSVRKACREQPNDEMRSL